MCAKYYLYKFQSLSGIYKAIFVAGSAMSNAICLFNNSKLHGRACINWNLFEVGFQNADDLFQVFFPVLRVVMHMREMLAYMPFQHF
jgi:hypothetical protein